MDIKGIAQKDEELPMWCKACNGLTTHLVQRTMPYDTPNGMRVDVFSICMRCQIKVEARRDERVHHDVWTVPNWNAFYNIQWVYGLEVRILKHTRMRSGL